MAVFCQVWSCLLGHSPIESRNFSFSIFSKVSVVSICLINSSTGSSSLSKTPGLKIFFRNLSIIFHNQLHTWCHTPPRDLGSRTQSWGRRGRSRRSRPRCPRAWPRSSSWRTWPWPCSWRAGGPWTWAWSSARICSPSPESCFSPPQGLIKSF